MGPAAAPVNHHTGACGGSSRKAWGLNSGSATSAMTGTTDLRCACTSVVAGLQRAVPERVVHGQHGAVVRGQHSGTRDLDFAGLDRANGRPGPSGVRAGVGPLRARPGARRCARGPPS